MVSPSQHFYGERLVEGLRCIQSSRRLFPCWGGDAPLGSEAKVISWNNCSFHILFMPPSASFMLLLYHLWHKRITSTRRRSSLIYERSALTGGRQR